MFLGKTTGLSPTCLIFGMNQSSKAMRRANIIIVILTVCLGNPVHAQINDPILKFMGTDSAEELDPYDVERLEDYLSSPLDINRASESRLRESGLFTPYQIASLTDYRARHGDIMSLTEFAAVDGFGHEFISRLSPFIDIGSNRLPSQSAGRAVRNEISVRTALKYGSTATYGMKYRMTAGERISGGLSLSRTSDSKSAHPDAYSGHIAYHFRKGKLVAGDFNARFGQGLALWNGLSFSGLASASTFLKRPSGISASSSFTGSYAMRGLAGDFSLGRVRISALTAFMKSGTGLSVLPAANVSYLFRHGQVSLTHYADFSGPSVRIPDMKTSAEAAFCISGFDIFAEATYDWISTSIAALAGFTAPAGEYVRLAAMLRYYPPDFNPARSAAARSTTKCSNEHALSLAADLGTVYTRHSGRLSADLAYSPVPKSSDAVMKSVQLKAQAEWAFNISPEFRTDLKVSERVRTWGEPFRTDVRADLSYTGRIFLMNLRINLLQCLKTGVLSYIEGGCDTDNLKIYLRSGIFLIDNWEDRIYSYERDAPGSFNVPAYSGRGVWGAVSMNWKFARWGRMYIRAAATAFPFMKEKKPGRAELKIHFVFRI